MTFRDDRDALLAQLEVFKTEARQHGAREGELTARVEELKQQLRAERKRTTRPSRIRWLVVLVIGGAVAALIFNNQISKREREARKAAKVKKTPYNLSAAGKRTRRLVRTKPDEPLPRAVYFAERYYNRQSRPATLAVVAVIARRSKQAELADALIKRAVQEVTSPRAKAASRKLQLRQLAVSHGTIACALTRFGRGGAGPHTRRAKELLGQAFIYREQAEGRGELALHCGRMGLSKVAEAHLDRAIAVSVKIKRGYGRLDRLLKLARLARLLKLKEGFSRVVAAIDLPSALRGSHGPEVLGRLAELGYRVVDKQQALELVRKTRGRRLTTARQLAHVGRAFARLGQRAEALEALDAATELARKGAYANDRTLTTIAEGYVILGQVQRAAKLSRDRRVQVAVALGHLKAGRTTAAVAASKQITRGDQRVAEALARAGEREVAAALCERITSYDKRARCLAWVHAAKH